ncbi:MKK3 [Symbiodinium sp. KB8]|nr:MKK3 [Symbiodinium sp. KB8]
MALPFWPKIVTSGLKENFARPPFPMATLAKPPEAIPDAYTNDVAKLHSSVATLFARKQIPYSVQSVLAQEGYVTLEDIADRWDDPTAARTNGPRALGFESGANGFTDQSSAFTAMRLFQAIKAAKDMTKNLDTPRACITPGQGSSERSGLEALCERQQLLTEWVKATGLPKPKLEAQGSDALLKTQFRFCSKGELGFINAKYIVSAQEKPFKTRRKVTVDGWDKEEEEEERKLPTTRRHLDRMHRVFRNNLSMCLLAFPQFSQLDVSKHDLDDWYDWFWGPGIAGRTPTPSEKTLLYAERKVYERVPRPGEKGPKGPSKGDKGDKGRQFARFPGKGSWKGKQPWSAPLPVFQPFLKQNGKGKDTLGKKGDHKGKGKDSWPQNWSRNNPKGTPFCRDYHIKKQCAGNRGRSHNCPVTKDGWVCNAPLALSKEQTAGAGPIRRRVGAVGPEVHETRVPTGAIVLPFAGKDDAASLEAILHSQGKDLLDDGLYGALCTAALHGVISFVGPGSGSYLPCQETMLLSLGYSSPPGLGIRRPESMLKEIAASLVRTLHGPSVERLAHAASNPTDSDCAESLGKEHDRWTDLGAAPAGAAVHPALPSLGGQRQEAGSPGAGTQAGDQFLASPEIGSDRPSTLPLSESLSLDDATMRVSHGFKALPLVPDFLASTASGAKQHPFPDSLLKEIRDFILPGHSQPDAGQPFFLDVIHSLLEEIHDVDSGGVWPLKSELIGEEWDPIEAPPPAGHKNYPSAEVFQAEIRATFVEEELCQCPMAGIDESDKIRSIFDGSKGGANLRIQQNTVEKTTAPTVMDCIQFLHWLRSARSRGGTGARGPDPLRSADSGAPVPVQHHGQADGCGKRRRLGIGDASIGSGRSWCFPDPTEEWVLLKADVTKAHRRIKVLLQEWRYQVAQLGNEWWVNTVGTYGMASAQLYWGRMAALLLRLTYAVFPEVDWGFVFVDDFAWLLRKFCSSLLATSMCLLLVALGTPP